jgi:hypothetical protein
MLFSLSSCLCDLILEQPQFEQTAPTCAACDSLEATHKLEKTRLIKEQESLRNQLSLARADVDSTSSELISLNTEYQKMVQRLTYERDDLRSQLDRLLSELTHQRKEPDSRQCRPPSRIPLNYDLAPGLFSPSYLVGSFATGPIGTDTYIITNVRFLNVAVLRDDSDGSELVSDVQDNDPAGEKVCCVVRYLYSRI